LSISQKFDMFFFIAGVKTFLKSRLPHKDCSATAFRSCGVRFRVLLGSLTWSKRKPEPLEAVTAVRTAPAAIGSPEFVVIAPTTTAVHPFRAR
jgi:hypothetical protein